MKRARFSEEQIIGILKAAEAAGNKTRLFRSSGLRTGLFPSSIVLRDDERAAAQGRLLSSKASNCSARGRE